MKAEFPVSEKIYAQLLRAYPASHREQYAAAMMQLFRDQCRDARAEAGNFGLLKLWLRAVPDLAGSSIRERLATLNERKTMNDKLANLSAYQNYSPGKTFVRVFTVVFLIVVIVATVATFLLPVTYASTAKIKVEPDMAPTNDAMAYSDPYFVQTTFEIMKSELVLTNVISALNLNDNWGKKYNGGAALKTEETMEILKNRMAFMPVGNTKMISITVYDEDKNEAATLANQVAKAYQQYREQNVKKVQADGLKVLEAQLEVQSNQLQVAVTDLKAQLQSDSNQISAATSRSELDDKRQLYTLLLSKVKMDKIDFQLPIYNMVQVTDPAEPAAAPIKPNRPLNITIGIVVGIILASMVGLLVLAVKRIARRKTVAAAV